MNRKTDNAIYGDGINMGYNIEELLNNFFIHDCCILSDKYFNVIAEEYLTEDEYTNDELGSIKIVSYNMRNPEIPPRWTYTHWNEKNVFYKPKLVNTKRDEALVVSNGGLVYYHGLGSNKKYEAKLPDIYGMSGSWGVKNINGKVYSVGVRSQVQLRKGVSEWQNLSAGLWNNKRKQGPSFFDIDGFSDDDLYAVGGENDVFRYDGQDWIALDVADHFRPKVVCCADDGYVYIAGAWGMVVRGREDNWQSKSIAEDSDVLFTAIVSYQGKILLGTEDRGTYVIEQNAEDFTPRPYDFEGELESFSARHMDVGYGMLMVAGDHEIALHDGEKWVGLYNSPEKREEKDLMVMAKVGEQLEEMIDDIGKAMDDIKKRL